MISGIFAISIAFVAASVSAAAFWLFYRDEDERFLSLAHRSFAVMGAAIVFSVVLLYYHIFTNNFQLNYVYSYTSLQLSTYYLISTFWAGQEGTFLLWLLFGTFFGMVLMKTTTRREPLVMFFVMLVQAFLLLILLKKSPFAMIWHTHADVPVGFIPRDGASLNPLLQNPWMIIHPPIMFVGYSSTVLAFAFAMNAMVKRKFDQWVIDARPWVIFSTLFLGTGIIMGGYWSYVTLGWGGYWAWDPVENASFVPWLFMAVLLHGIIIQIRQNGLAKTNLFLGGLGFISVLWGSFLTRSGVLADFSVHSFAASDLNLYLITFVALFSGMFLYYFVKSFKEIKSPKFAEGIFSRETFILIGMMSLLFTGIMVFIGTSSPIYTGLIGEPANVSINFYNTISIPVAIFMLFSMAIAPVLIWKVSQLREKRNLLIGAAISLLITVIGVTFGLNKPVSIILVFLSSFVVIINSIVAFRLITTLPSKGGAYLSHIGIGFMIIGIITSSMYNQSEKITLPAGQFQSTKFGYDIQFVDFEQRADGKDRAKLIVKRQDGSYEADPQFYFSEYTQSYMLSPHVKVGINKDIYISPISFIPGQTQHLHQLELAKSETKEVDGLNITFNRFVVGEHMDQSPMAVKADLTVTLSQENYEKEITVQPAIWMENGKLQGSEVSIPDTPYKLHLESIDANEGRILLVVEGGPENEDEPKDVLSIEVSEKPLISILWFGCIVLIAGLTISWVDRTRKKK
ncbi:MAG: cytochrome c biogenesis protein CcsA [bacterium]|nr:MAG: cytochrome c biogenesis protein CcsA [bacterium]